MTKKTASSSGQKFFFDVNIFDEGYVDPSIPVEPPPPVFSQQELESSQSQAFERGRQHGLRESAESREQAIAQTLARISKDMTQLFAAEDAREKIYEDEALRLAAAILEKLFPALHATHGFEELKTAISGVLSSHEGQGEVAIEVHPNDADEIGRQLEGLSGSGQNLRYTVRGREGLTPHSCRISWKDGGAIKDSQALAAEIRAILEDTLAAHGRSGHNRGNPEETGSGSVAQEE